MGAGGLLNVWDLRALADTRGTTPLVETLPAPRSAQKPQHKDRSQHQDQPELATVPRSERTLALIYFVLVFGSSLPHGQQYRQDLSLSRQSSVSLVVRPLQNTAIRSLE